MPAKVKFFDGTHNFTLNYPKESGNETENLRYPRKKRNMKTNFFSLQLILVLLLCLGGCTLDTLLPTIQTTYIRGGKINGFHPSSRNSTPQSLPVGSQITFYSQGGLTAEGTLLTYNGSYWEGDIDLTWNTEHSQAQTCAFYPPFHRNHSSIYQEGKLSDLLCSQKDFHQGEEIRLSFNHLFARLTFQVSRNLNQRLERITFTPSLSVADIQPETGKLYLQDTEIPLTLEHNNSGEYSFLLPPAQQSVHIRITTPDGNSLETTMGTHSFLAGYEYTCPLKLSGNDPGIETVEDFIAFTHLINGETYENRSLEEFGETTGETTTYYLHNDLSFTPEEAAKIQMIGMYGTANGSQKRLFNDTFDGQGHSLSNLLFQQSYLGYYYVGLFSGVSPSGVIKNLIISEATYDKTKDTKSASFLAGLNRGIIDNCIIKNCIIKNVDDESEFGSISSQNEGLIINCQVDNISLKSVINYASGIVRYNNKGKILNCFVSNCNFSKAKLGGFICTKSLNGEIQNCYVTGNAYKCNPISFATEYTNVIRCCYYPQSNSKSPAGNAHTVLKSDSLMKYGSLQSITVENLYHTLNLWIQGTGATTYPELSFRSWEKGESLPAVLVSP